MFQNKFNNYLNNLDKKNRIEIKTKEYKNLLNKNKYKNLLNKNKYKNLLNKNISNINEPNLPNLPDEPLTKEDFEQLKKFEQLEK
jgi:DNA-binding transcriptional regulator/RsmH inhibitor MraZ